MSVCNYTQIVTPNTCLGDSLATFNNNFLSLDEGLCKVPSVVSKEGLNSSLTISEQGIAGIQLASTNSFVYKTTVESNIGGSSTNLPLNDGTTMAVTTFPLLSGSIPVGTVDPLVTFSTVSLTKNIPKVTMFWTAAGANKSTIYATNSASSGQIMLNGSVTSMLSSGSLLYVGGDFTTIGGQDSKKFCVLNLYGGVTSALGFTGTVAYNPLSGDMGFGDNGTINAIAETNTFLIFGGSYQSLAKGRGLTIYNKYSGNIYPFYVNGTVNSVLVVGNSLYVGGTFDYVNYTAKSSSVISGLRVFTNGLVKINLATLIGFPNNSIDVPFASSVLQNFDKEATINSITSVAGTVYIGGLFQAYNSSTIVSSNIAIINPDGTLGVTWKPIVLGEVYTLAIDGSYLYVGGKISAAYSSSEFASAPRPEGTAYNAICYKITTPITPVFQSNWKPQFNGAVSRFAFHDTDPGSYVYCYGSFTQVNDSEANYAAAIAKSIDNTVLATNAPWKMDIDKAPNKINQGLIRYGNSLVFGGNFAAINGQSRKGIGRVSGVYESQDLTLPPAVVWNVGAKCCSPGATLNLDLTNFATITSYAGAYGTVNQSTFPETYMSSVLNNSTEGSLIRFFVTRPRNSGTLSEAAHVIGWKVSFN